MTEGNTAVTVRSPVGASTLKDKRGVIAASRMASRSGKWRWPKFFHREPHDPSHAPPQTLGANNPSAAARR